MTKHILIVAILFLFSTTFGQKIDAHNLVKVDSLNRVYLNSSLKDTSRFQAYVEMSKIYSVGFPDSAINICSRGILWIDAAIKSSIDNLIVRRLTISKIDLLNNLSASFLAKSRFDESFETSMLAINLAQNIEYQNGLSIAYNNIGSFHKKKEEYAKAIEYYQMELAIEEQMGRLSSVALCYSNIGLMHSKIGDIELSVSSFLKSVLFYEVVKDTVGIASGYNNLAATYRNIGKLDLALEFLFKSLNLKELTGDKKAMAPTLGNIGSTLYAMGNVAEALEYYNRSVEVRDEIGDRKGMGIVLGNIGVIYLTQEDFLKALVFIQKSLAIRVEMNDKSGIGNSYHNLASIYRAQGNLISAMEYHKLAKEIREGLGEKQGLSTTLNSMGNVYLDSKDYDNAMACFEQALIITEAIGYKEGKAVSYANIGSVYRAKMQHEEALINFQKSKEIQIEIGDKVGIVYTLWQMGVSYLAMNDTVNALLNGTEAFNSSAESGFTGAIRSASQLLYEISAQRGEFERALYFLSLINKSREKELEQNYFKMAEREKELYFATMETDFMRYYEFTVINAETHPALTDTCYNLVLRNKGLALKSSTAMRNAILGSNDSSLINLYDNWISVKKEISEKFAGGKETVELEEKANSMEKELVSRSAVFSDFSRIKNLDWKTVRNNLSKGEAAIEFIQYNEYLTREQSMVYAALIVTPLSEHPKIVKLFYEDDLQKILTDYKGNNLQYVNSVYGTINKTNRKLYELIWQPMEANLKGVKKVFLSPTGLLHKISFAAISKQDDVYLCDSYNLNFESSTGNIVGNLDFNLNAESMFTVFGGVDYNKNEDDRNAWSYLPGTLTETQNIAGLIEKANYPINFYTDSSASETTLKSSIGNATFIHVATHGFFYGDPEEIKLQTDTIETEDLVFRGSTNYANWSFVNNKNPLMRSGLVLAGANSVWSRDPFDKGDDGILTAHEVSSLDLRKAQLVVLSACETGLGDIKGSEGVYGLQRAFKMAGVRYIIMSLWQVPDLETAEFMTIFYKNLFKLKDVKKAFVVTQKIMRKKYDPYYWAAFVLIE